MQFFVKFPILLHPILEKKSYVPAPVENLLSMYAHTCVRLGSMKLRIINRTKENTDRKYMMPQVKYMISLTRTTEKQAMRIAATPPSSANAKKHP